MSKLEQALEESLAFLASGEATLEECLDRYPEHAAELRRLLAVTSRLEPGRALRPSAQVKASGRAQLIAHMRANPRRQEPDVRLVEWPRRLHFFLNFAATTAVLLLLFLGTGTVLAQQALPGQGLYRWRIASEMVWRVLSPDPLAVDLAVAKRRMEDLTTVAGDPQAEPLARWYYSESLTELTSHTEPESQAIISTALATQKDNLDEAGVTVPELDEAISVVSQPQASLSLDYTAAATQNGLIVYTLSVANNGPAGQAEAVLTTSLSPAETLVSVSDPACSLAGGGRLTCPLADVPAGQPYRLELTTTTAGCYAGVITHTATVTGAGRLINTNADNSLVIANTVTPAYPGAGQLVYVTSRARRHDLGLAALTGDDLNNELHIRAAAPAWSPDGTMLAFFGEEGISELGAVYSHGNGLWLADIVRNQIRNPRQLVSQDHIRTIAWSPNGAMLAFEVGPPDLPHEVVVVDAADGHEFSRFPGEQPAWTPDSRSLVIKTCTPECGLWQVSLAGETEQQLTSGDTDSYPAWSPDGQSMAFASRRDGNWEIYLLQVADGRLTRLTSRPGTDTTPVFGPCSQEIYLRTDQFGDWWVTVMKLDGSDELKIRDGVGPSDDWGLARPAVR